MASNTISRRNFFGMTAGAAATAGLAPLLYPTLADASSISGHGGGGPSGGFALTAGDAASYQVSIDDAYTFLDTMMDAYAQGDTVRLTQSYSDQGGLLTTAFTYDNAVAIHAYLLRGREDDVERAKVLGNGLIYAQANNVPISDGRFAQAYFVNVPPAMAAVLS